LKVSVLDFLRNHVWNPLFARGGYNPYSTLALALFFIAVVELYWRLFAREKDQGEFRRVAVPFIVLGGLLRFADTRLVPPTPLTVTPGVYLLVLAIFTLSYQLLGAQRARKLGTLASIALLLSLTPFLHPAHAPLLVLTLIICWLTWKVYSRLDFMEDLFAWLPHVFEAWITSFGVWAGLMEEHVIAGILMGKSPFLFGVVKTLLLPLIMSLLKNVEDQQKKYVGTVIGMLGLGPGVRDLLELLSLGG